LSAITRVLPPRGVGKTALALVALVSILVVAGLFVYLNHSGSGANSGGLTAAVISGFDAMGRGQQLQDAASAVLSGKGGQGVAPPSETASAESGTGAGGDSAPPSGSGQVAAGSPAPAGNPPTSGGESHPGTNTSLEPPQSTFTNEPPSVPVPPASGGAEGGSHG
jgi:hypothetical protein